MAVSAFNPQQDAIDRSSQIPYYVQIKEILIDKIERGELRPNDQLPSEPRLCEIFDVSRTVVRQALRELSHEGLLERRKGKGTFVAEEKLDYRLNTLISFSRLMRSLGHSVTTHVLDQHIINAPPKIASQLSVDTDSPIVEIKRLRSVDREPVAIHTSYLPAASFAGLLNEDLVHRSLWDSIERVSGIRASYSKDIVEATLLRQEEADLLERRIGNAALLIRGLAFDSHDRPIRYTKAVYSGDVFRFKVDAGQVGVLLEVQESPSAGGKA